MILYLIHFAVNCEPGSQQIFFAERDKPIFDDFGGQVLLSVVHPDEWNCVSMQNRDHVNLVIRWLIDESLILVREVNQALATNLHWLK